MCRLLGWKSGTLQAEDGQEEEEEEGAEQQVRPEELVSMET